MRRAFKASRPISPSTCDALESRSLRRPDDFVRAMAALDGILGTLDWDPEPVKQRLIERIVHRTYLLSL